MSWTPYADSSFDRSHPGGTGLDQRGAAMKGKAHSLVVALTAFSLCSGPKLFAFGDGQPSSGVLGQIDFNEHPLFTRGGEDNGPSIRGFHLPMDMKLDPVRHRLFVADELNSRILVFNLDSENNLVRWIPDHVLGQPNFQSAVRGPSRSVMSLPGSLLIDDVHARLFVSDTGNNRVLIFDVSQVSDGQKALNVLGQPDFSSNSPSDSMSRLNSPGGLAYDHVSSRLFISDTGNNRVLVFDLRTLKDGMPAGLIAGGEDVRLKGAASHANEIHSPQGLVYDALNQRLFVSDSGNNRVLLFQDRPGENEEWVAEKVLGQRDLSSTVAGAGRNKLKDPQGLTYDSANAKLFVSDGGNNRILIFGVSALVNGQNAENVLGQGDFQSTDAAVSQNQMDYPRGLAYDETGSRLFVADGGSDFSSNNRILVFSLNRIRDGQNAAGVLGQLDAFDRPLFSKGGANNSPNDQGFHFPSNVAVDPVRHHLFVSDRLNNRVLVFKLDSHNKLVSLTADHVLGQPGFTSGGLSAGEDGMSDPQGLACDSVGGRLFVADSANNRVLVYDVEKELLNGEKAVAVLGQEDFRARGAATSQREMTSPRGLAYDPVKFRLFVSDGGIAPGSSGRVLVFDVVSVSNGQKAINVLGQEGFTSAPPASDGSAMDVPQGLAYDSSHCRLFVADGGNKLMGHNRVLVFDVSTIENGKPAIGAIGQPDLQTNLRGHGADQLNDPNGLAYDPSHSRLFVSDSGNNRVLVFDVSGGTGTPRAAGLLGRADASDKKDSPAKAPGETEPEEPSRGSVNQFSLNFPQGVAYNNDNGLMFVADAGNNRVLVFDDSFQFKAGYRLEVTFLFDTGKWFLDFEGMATKNDRVNSASTTPAEYRTWLSNVASFLSEHPKAKARIDGHADNVGSAEFNVRLSEKRAGSIKDSLVQLYKIEESRIITKGFGYRKPVADNSTASGRRANRRAVVSILY